MLLQLVIFVSGAAILALELLASRIMTPYFGVSLYIWAGVLSITLIALAAGYWAGGKLANARSIDNDARLMLFGLMPALAAVFIVLACLIYPFAFAPLAAWSLSAGSFVACLILLAVPLLAASAMNPLLVAIAAIQHKAANTGDGGAGHVFFISTVGSVAGVLITAFGLIPYVAHYDAVLLVATLLAALGLLIALKATFKRRTLVMTASIIGIAASLLMLWQADNYTGRKSLISYHGEQWRIEATFRSLFGTVKILRQEPDASGYAYRMYFQDGLTQNAVEMDGRSRSFYTYALEALALAYHPDARNALALGLGAGMTPARLAARGIKTEIVEIDPASLAASRQFFGLDESKTPVHQTDARTFVQRCQGQYDVVVVDLFHGDGTPDYLITRNFFRDLRACIASGGIAVFNTFADLENTVSYAHLLSTLRAELPHLALFRPNTTGATHTNSFIVASTTPLRAPARVTMDGVPQRHETHLWDMLAAPLPLNRALFDGGKVITDARNQGALDLAHTARVYRRTILGFTPPEFLLN